MELLRAVIAQILVLEKRIDQPTLMTNLPVNLLSIIFTGTINREYLNQSSEQHQDETFDLLTIRKSSQGAGTELTSLI